MKRGDTNISEKKRTNREIHAAVVRLIGEQGDQLGIMSFGKALETAAAAGLDLVEMAPGNPTVCRLVDNYLGAFYRKSKAKKKQKTSHKTGQVKEIKFRPTTEEADYQVKLRRAHTLLEQGYKIKASLRFRGREISHQDLGLVLLQRLENDLEPQALVEQRPKLEGRQMIMQLAPRRKKD